MASGVSSYKMPLSVRPVRTIVPFGNALEAATVDALRELGMDTTIDHVRDFEKIAAYGVMTTPALVVDGQVVSYGKVLKKDEVIVILKKVRA